MNIIIAPDSFKGNMSSDEVCEVISSGLQKKIPYARISCIPMADGGEGTVKAAVSASGGRIIKTNVLGPLMREIESFYGISGDGKCAVIEMAAASGIELLELNELDPLKTTTFGTGQLIKDALDENIREFIIGIGGSATNDGGVGMAQALGIEFFDANDCKLPDGIGGGELGKIKNISISKLDKRLNDCVIKVACDVENPLLGSNGASNVYGPQKGADKKKVSILDNNLKNYSELLIRNKLADDCIHHGDGAAGGLGFGLRCLLNAKMVSGAKLLMEFNDFEEKLNDADFLITGEGRTDSQSVCGKLCCQLAEAAKNNNVRSILVSGGIEGDMKNLRRYFDAFFSISMGVCNLEQALANGKDNLYETAESIGALIAKCGE